MSIIPEIQTLPDPKEICFYDFVKVDNNEETKPFIDKFIKQGFIDYGGIQSNRIVKHSIHKGLYSFKILVASLIFNEDTYKKLKKMEEVKKVHSDSKLYYSEIKDILEEDEKERDEALREPSL